VNPLIGIQTQEFVRRHDCNVFLLFVDGISISDIRGVIGMRSGLKEL
jgi:hypothetical protein